MRLDVETSVLRRCVISARSFDDFGVDMEMCRKICEEIQMALH